MSDVSIFTLLLIALYFLPTVVADLRKHHQAASITVINIFLGWTFIGWVVALAMASSRVQRDPPARPPARPPNVSQKDYSRGPWG